MVEAAGEALQQEVVVQNDEVVVESQDGLLLKGEEVVGPHVSGEFLPHLLWGGGRDAQEGVERLLLYVPVRLHRGAHLRRAGRPGPLVGPHHEPHPHEVLYLHARGVPHQLCRVLL